MSEIKIPKKLIEVALPLDDINAACVREKSIRHGHPSTLHLWWARRPLAAARAVLFAQLVNDPGYERNLGRGVNKEKAAHERERLFGIIRELVKWENTNNEKVLNEAREEIWKSWRETCALNREHPQAKELFNPDKLPAFHDPFAGGGAIPLEAQRLGLESHASDLNPVAVLINKAMIEIPSRFIGKKPVGQYADPKNQPTMLDNWTGTNGIAEDVRRYGSWIQKEAFKLIGSFYPKVEITSTMASERPDLKPLIGQQLTVIAWLWARTVKSPNPAYSDIEVPLVASFWLSTRTGKEAWVESVIRTDKRGYDFVVRTKGKPKLEETVNRKGGICLISGTPIEFKYIRSEGKEGRIGTRLMAVVVDGPRGRIYISPTHEIEAVARQANPENIPDTNLPEKALGFRVQEYGMVKHRHLFTPRQLVALATFSDLIQGARTKIKDDAVSAGMIDDKIGIDSGGVGALAYAEAVSTYLAFALSKIANTGSTIATWMNDRGAFRETFARQAIPMVWDFAEANPFADTGGSFLTAIDKGAMAIETVSTGVSGVACQADASNQNISERKLISTDPPYYDNIGYADLSDFFYIWLRRTLKPVFPSLFTTVTVPKIEELVATPFRHGGKAEAEVFFLDGMTKAMHRLSEQAHPAFPVTIYYAFKASESSAEGTASTGWETFLEAVFKAGFAITGTWPMRTEGEGRIIAKGTNALASSIILVCRQRPALAAVISRREFIRELNSALPDALTDITLGGVNSPIAPVDLSQAIIGPGMAVFSKYSAVLEADGVPMTVRTALQLINRFFAEDDFDHDTQFCLHWFENYGWGSGLFGDANTLAQAKGTSVDGVRDAGVIESGSGKVRLLRFNEYPSDWSPETDGRTPIWEALHHLIRALQSGGESAAGDLLAHMPGRIESIRQLAYRLYTLCERKGWAEDARSYNELITSWEATEAVSLKASTSREKQIEMEL